MRQALQSNFELFKKCKYAKTIVGFRTADNRFFFSKKLYDDSTKSINVKTSGKKYRITSYNQGLSKGGEGGRVLPHFSGDLTPLTAQNIPFNSF